MVRVLRSLSCIVAVVCLLCCSALAYDDEPPRNPPFYGSAFVSGSSRELGYIDVYFPISYQDGYLGTDENGYLFNVSNTSITCYLEGYESCNIPAWSYPRYREQSGAGWQYEDLHIIPESTNVHIAQEMTPVYSLSDLLPFASILLLGVIFVCYMKRS